MGCVSESDIVTGISLLENGLAEMKYAFTKGAGVKAAETAFKKSTVGV